MTYKLSASLSVTSPLGVKNLAILKLCLELKIICDTSWNSNFTFHESQRYIFCTIASIPLIANKLLAPHADLKLLSY